jgi:hypothetical protein
MEDAESYQIILQNNATGTWSIYELHGKQFEKRIISFGWVVN